MTAKSKRRPANGQAKARSGGQDPPKANNRATSGETADNQGAKADKSAASRARRWLRKPAVWAVTIIVTGALSALGQQLEAGGSGAIRHAAHGSRKTASKSLRKADPLDVNTTVSYTDQAAVALAAPLKSGQGYTELLKGIADNGYGSGWGPFLAANNGAPVGELHMDLVLTGQAATAVRVTNIRIQMAKQPRPKLTGTYIPIPHAGGQEAYQFTAHLDSASPAIIGVKGQQSFPDFNVSLADGEQATIAIDFFANHYTYAWVLYIDYLQGAQKRTLRVTQPNGKPFILTAAAARYHATYLSNYPEAGYHLGTAHHP